MSLGLLSTARAAVKTWGGATSGNWGTGSNWSGGSPVDGDDLVFPVPASRFTTTNNISGLNLRSITFAGSNYVHRGNSITLTNGITANNASRTNIIEFAIQLDAAQSFNCLNAAATLAINGVISGAGDLTKIGLGTLTFGGSADNTYTGDTIVNAGILQLAKSAGWAIQHGSLTIGDGMGGSHADIVRYTGASGSMILVGVAITVNGFRVAGFEWTQ